MEKGGKRRWFRAQTLQTCREQTSIMTVAYLLMTMTEQLMSCDAAGRGMFAKSDITAVHYAFDILVVQPFQQWLQTVKASPVPFRDFHPRTDPLIKGWLKFCSSILLYGFAMRGHGNDWLHAECAALLLLHLVDSSDEDPFEAQHMAFFSHLFVNGMSVPLHFSFELTAVSGAARAHASHLQTRLGLSNGSRVFVELLFARRTEWCGGATLTEAACESLYACASRDCVWLEICLGLLFNPHWGQAELLPRAFLLRASSEKVAGLVDAQIARLGGGGGGEGETGEPAAAVRLDAVMRMLSDDGGAPSAETDARLMRFLYAVLRLAPRTPFYHLRVTVTRHVHQVWAPALTLSLPDEDCCSLELVVQHRGPRGDFLEPRECLCVPMSVSALDRLLTGEWRAPDAAAPTPEEQARLRETVLRAGARVLPRQQPALAVPDRSIWYQYQDVVEPVYV